MITLHWTLDQSAWITDATSSDFAGRRSIFASPAKETRVRCQEQRLIGQAVGGW